MGSLKVSFNLPNHYNNYVQSASDLESYYPHGYHCVHFTMLSPTFSPVLQKAGTTELLSDAGTPLISIATVSLMEHSLLVGFPVLHKIPALACVLFISESCLTRALLGDAVLNFQKRIMQSIIAILHHLTKIIMLIRDNLTLEPRWQSDSEPMPLTTI